MRKGDIIYHKDRSKPLPNVWHAHGDTPGFTVLQSNFEQVVKITQLPRFQRLKYNNLLYPRFQPLFNQVTVASTLKSCPAVHWCAALTKVFWQFWPNKWLFPTNIWEKNKSDDHRKSGVSKTHLSELVPLFPIVSTSAKICVKFMFSTEASMLVPGRPLKKCVCCHLAQFLSSQEYQTLNKQNCYH